MAGILSKDFCKIINANFFILHQKSFLKSAEGTGYQSKDNLMISQKNVGQKALTMYL